MNEPLYYDDDMYDNIENYDAELLESWMIEIFEKNEKDIYEAFGGDMEAAREYFEMMLNGFLEGD